MDGLDKELSLVHDSAKAPSITVGVSTFPRQSPAGSSPGLGRIRVEPVKAAVRSRAIPYKQPKQFAVRLEIPPAEVGLSRGQLFPKVPGATPPSLALRLDPRPDHDAVGAGIPAFHRDPVRAGSRSLPVDPGSQVVEVVVVVVYLTPPVEESKRAIRQVAQLGLDQVVYAFLRLENEVVNVFPGIDVGFRALSYLQRGRRLAGIPVVILPRPGRESLGAGPVTLHEDEVGIRTGSLEEHPRAERLLVVVTVGDVRAP